MATKKIPMRTCVGCREMKPKNELVRVVRTPEGAILLDVTGKKNGRGAYVCRSAECLKKAEKSNALARVLEVPVDHEIYERLREEQEKLGK